MKLKQMTRAVKIDGVPEFPQFIYVSQKDLMFPGITAFSIPPSKEPLVGRYLLVGTGSTETVFKPFPEEK